MTHHIGVHEGEDAVTIIIGIDPHKATHTAVAIDETEHALAVFQLAADRCQMRLFLHPSHDQHLIHHGALWFRYASLATSMPAGYLPISPPWSCTGRAARRPRHK